MCPNGKTLDAQPVFCQLQQTDSAQSQLFVVREGDRSAVDECNTVAMFQTLLVSMASDHHVDRMWEVLAEHGHRAELASQAVCHADSPALDVDDLHFLTPRVRDGVVIAGGTEYWRELLQPIEHVWRSQIAPVKDQVDAVEEFRRLGSELFKLADYIGQVGVGEESYNHAPKYTNYGAGRSMLGEPSLDPLEVADALPVGYGLAVGLGLGSEEVCVVGHHVFSERRTRQFALLEAPTGLLRFT